MQEFFEKFCALIGEDSQREGLQNTPQRLLESFQTLYSGYQKSPKDVFHTTFTQIAYDEMIVIKEIEFYSMCEHHLLPFFGKISIGYIPNQKIAGVSDFAKVIEVFSRRLQTQEAMTTQIIESIMQELDPKGAMLVCKAKHLCMAMRGVQKQSAELITSAVRGIFRDNPKTRAEFLEHIR